MTLHIVADWTAHFAFMNELRERCAAQVLNSEANEGAESVVSRITEEMIADGKDPGWTKPVEIAK